mmetsp:Transcript_92097/g.201852  ORF Transcript_92097/g.201852 Transcript_92097/m.201852 type:complete len:603 (+) Transcript_92097:105-1913(+)
MERTPIAVAALGAQASPFFLTAQPLPTTRNDWSGEIGIRFKVLRPCAVQSIGRGLCCGAEQLQESVPVTLWKCPDEKLLESEETLVSVLATKIVGPESLHEDGFAFEMLDENLTLEVGQEYRLTQRCHENMLDSWPEGDIEEDVAESASGSSCIRFLGGVYNFHGGFPSFLDGAEGTLRRLGMLNLKLIDTLGHFGLDPQAPLSELKVLLEDLTGMPPLQQQLFLEGALLTNDQSTFVDIGVSHGGLLWLALRPAAFIAVVSEAASVETGGSPSALSLWSLDEGSCSKRIGGHEGRIRSVAYSPTGGEVLTGSDDGSAKLWCAEHGICLHSFEGHQDKVRAACFSPSGARILTCSEDGTAKLWDAESRACIATMSVEIGALTSCCFSPNGQRAITHALDGSFHLWNTEMGSVFEGKLVHLCREHRGTVMDASFSADSSKLLTTSLDTSCPVLLWDPEDCRRLQSFGPGIQMRQAMLTPGGDQVVTVDVEHCVRAWETTTGILLRELAHDAQALSASISLDGMAVLTSSADNILRLWKLDSGDLMHVLSGHTDEVTSMTFHPDGEQVISSSRDGTLRSWSMSGGECVRTLEIGEAITLVALSP